MRNACAVAIGTAGEAHRAAAGACGRSATGTPPDPPADVVILRYLDVCLVLATAPFVLARRPADRRLPDRRRRVAADARGHRFVQARARRVGDPKLRAGLQVAGMMGRVWLVALAIILARFAGGKDDGIMAAALVLAAFTVYFVMSFFTREGPLQRRAGTPGRPSAS